MRKLDLSKPVKGSKEILVMDWSSGFGKIVVDALNWSDARAQLNAHFLMAAQ